MVENRKNYQTTHVFTCKCSKLYFEPFQALLLVTYPIIHPQDLKSKHFPFQGLLQQKSLYFKSYDNIDHPQHNTTSLLMLRNTLLHPISHESELLLLFLLEVSAFSLPFPFVHRHSPPHIIWYVFIKSYQGHPKKSGPSAQFWTYSGPFPDQFEIPDLISPTANGELIGE